MTSKTDIWMPIYIGDYLGATARLSTIQHGAYLLLIMDYWKSGPPPDDDAVLAQIVRMSPADWQAHKSTLRALFNVAGGLWCHSRIDRELSEAGSRKAAAASKAKAAAEKRWGKPEPEQESCLEHSSSIPQAMLGSCPSPSPSSLPTKQSKAKATVRSAPAQSDEGLFPEAWLAYPKRAGSNSRADAVKCWYARIRDGETPEAMLAGTRRYASFIVATGKTGTEFVMQASRFYGKSMHYRDDWRPPATASPPQSAPSKTLQAMQLLQDMKNGLDRKGNYDGVPELGVLEHGSPARAGRIADDG